MEKRFPNFDLGIQVDRYPATIRNSSQPYVTADDPLRLEMIQKKLSFW